MISFTEAQIQAWLAPFLWPFLRVLAVFSAMPIFNRQNVPLRLRIALAAFITVAAQPALPPMPAIALDSPTAVLVVVQQVLIGLTIGFAVRVVFAAVEYAGELIGLQMGLNFAGFFDPLSASTATATSRFYGTLVAWLFIVINGHLIVIAALVQSFSAFPIGPEPFEFLRATQPHRWGAEIFSLGLWIALPMVTMMLFVNLTLGAMSRVAPQINIFAIGFPVTLGLGLLGLLLTLPTMQMPFTMALERLLVKLSV
jgi:flagellar biosynthetic protein FliR